VQRRYYMQAEPLPGGTMLKPLAVSIPHRLGRDEMLGVAVWQAAAGLRRIGDITNKAIPGNVHRLGADMNSCRP
jgi:hypothetical protein